MDELVVDGETVLLPGYELDCDWLCVSHIIVGDDSICLPVYRLDGDFIVPVTRVLDGEEVVFPIVFHTLADLTEQVIFPKGLVSNGESIFNDGFRSEKEGIFSKGFLSKFLSKFLAGIFVRGGIDADDVNVENKITSKFAVIERVSSEHVVAETATLAYGEIVVAQVNRDLTVDEQVRVGGRMGSKTYYPEIRGWSVDGDGMGEMKGLRLREFLDVPELRYNRVSVIAGEKWSAPGGGIIAEVSDGYFDLKLEDGELPTLDVDDICKGIFHSDRRFATCYFRVLEVTSTGRIRYAPRENYTFAPQRFMQIVAYGNFTKKDRQYSALITREYTRYYRGVNKWDIDPEMIALQLGNLDGLFVGGRDLSGYSAYLKNVYMTGTIKQLSNDGETESDIPFFKGAWVQYIYYWYDEVTHNGSTWLCIAENGTSEEPMVNSLVWLERSAKGKDAITLRGFSSTGYEFYREGQTYQASFRVEVFRAELCVTAEYDTARFVWARTSENPSADLVWDELHIYTGNELSITEIDLVGDTSFSCSLYDNKDKLLKSIQF